ncbi:hypothetical protein [uncultured Phocaeicola sp.]|uniref:hypothetical protein n=1 Tax=uncultured Phocaeicola sp. TaxID=990718 RepID=UPI0025FEAD30|nr:hypothetical protein [uncultured Phocaeicola sp.]
MKKIPVLSFLLIVLILFLVSITIIRQKTTPIVSSFCKERYVSLSEDSMNFLFDTGANMTVFYADTMPEYFYYLNSLIVKDISGNQILAKQIFSFYPKLGFMRGNLKTVCLLSQKYQWGGYNGIIGTDLIDKNNWLIDFRKGKIYSDSLPLKKKTDMSIHYESDNGLYYADFEIEGINYPRILIDTGYDRSDFMFRNLNLKQINSMRFCKEDSCYGVVGNGFPIKIYQKSNNKINGTNFANITYAVSESHNTVGILFFKRFSYIVWNTKEQVIECFY